MRRRLTIRLPDGPYVRAELSLLVSQVIERAYPGIYQPNSLSTALIAHDNDCPMAAGGATCACLEIEVAIETQA